MSLQSGWHATDRHYGIRGADLSVHSMFTAAGRIGGGTAGDFTILIPFYFNPSVTNAFEWHFISSGTKDNTTRNMRIYVVRASATTFRARISYPRSPWFNVVSAEATANFDNLHGMVAVTYDHSEGTMSVYLCQEGVIGVLASGSETANTLDDVSGSDQICIGNYNATGSGNVNIGADFPVLGVVCRKDILDSTAIANIWGDGTAPNFRNLFPALASDLAWTLGMVNIHHKYILGSVKEYKVWDVAPNSDDSRIHYWKDETDGITGGNYIDSLRFPIDGSDISIEDAIAINGGTESSEINLASFFDPNANEGGFWQPGQPIHTLGNSTVGGNIPGFLSVINGTRSGSIPFITGSFGNSRMANLTGTSLIDDASPLITAPRSLGYGFARSRPEHFGGIMACNVGTNIHGGTNLYDRFDTGSPSLSRGNHARLGFGSSDGANGPGGTWMLANLATTTVRYNVTDPDGTSGVRDVQPVVVLAKRPGAGSADVKSNSHTTDDSLAGAVIGGTYNTGSLSTTVNTVPLFGAVSNGATSIVITGQTSSLSAGHIIQFAEDDDINEIVTVLDFDGNNTTYSVKFPVNGLKASLGNVSGGPLEYAYIGAGNIDEVPSSASEWVGSIVTATGNVEVVGIGFYYTDKPNSIFQIIQGWGGHGEKEQLDAGFTGAWKTFASAVGMQGALLALATQNEGDMQGSLEGRMGSLVDSIEVLGAPEGAYATQQNMLIDSEFTNATSGALDFAAAHNNVVYLPVFDLAYDFVTAAYLGYMDDSAHQSPEGAIFRGGLLWNALDVFATGSGSGSGSVATSSTSPRIAGNPVAAAQDSLERFYLLFAATAESLVLSNSKLVLNGIPISTFETSSGSLAIGVYLVDETSDLITNSDLSVSDDNYVMNGFKFSFYEDLSGNRVFRYGGDAGSTAPSSSTVWQGVQIAKNENNAIIAKTITGAIDSLEKSYFGGVPLLVAVIGNNKYLAIKQ